MFLPVVIAVQPQQQQVQPEKCAQNIKNKPKKRKIHDDETPQQRKERLALNNAYRKAEKRKAIEAEETPVGRKERPAIAAQKLMQQRKAMKIKESVAISTPPEGEGREKSRRKQHTPRKVVEPDEVFRLVNLKDRSAIPLTGKPSNNVAARVYRRKNKPRKVTMVSIAKSLTADSEVFDTCNEFNASTLFTDDVAVQFHTSIDTLENLRSLFCYLNSQMDKWPEKYSSSVPIPRFEQFCLTLMSIRYDLQPRDIASQFNLSKYDVTRCVDRFISAMIQFLVPRRWQKCKDEENSTPSLATIFKGQCPLGKSVYIIDFVQVQVDRGFNYLKFFISFSACGRVCYAWTGYPGLINEIHMLRFSGMLAQLSHGDILICKSSNQMIDVFEFDQSSHNQLKKSSLILEFESLLHVRKIINVFKSRFAILRNMSVSSPYSTNYCNFYHVSHSSPSVDLSVQVCCAIHNSNPREIIVI